MKKVLTFLFLFTLSVYSAFATHNRAGEITYKHISGLNYEVTITTYTKESSTAADRTELEIAWGDGLTDILQRDNGNGVLLGNDIKMNKYIGTHVYPGPGQYIISMLDPNRNSEIVNMIGSVNLAFYIESTLIISPFGSGSYNNSPLLLNPPVDNACLNRFFIHNAGATDPDGDSLSYELIDVRQDAGVVVTGYYIPPNVSINAVTGDLVWNVPGVIGEFNFAFIIKEWRKNGNSVKLIGSVVRDLQVNVSPCNNNPPVISSLIDTCVNANTFLEYNISATDSDGNTVTLEATGGPFIVQNPAQFQQGVTNTGNVSANLTWQVKCSHVRNAPYTVLVKAFDNGVPSLSDYKSFNIKVVGPSPKNPSAGPSGNNILVNWDVSICSEVTSYKIYRRTGSYGFIPSHCELGVPFYTGFSLVATVQGHANNSYLDPNLVHGQQYCYMIVAVFPDGAESYASEEVCSELKKNVPIMTNVSVEQTALNGRIYTAWSAPDEVDTIQHPGPYRYLIHRSEGMSGSNYQLIDSTALSTNFYDTIYTDIKVNTFANPNNYKVELVNRNLSPNGFYQIGYTHPAASVWLEVTPVSTGNALNLSWQVNVPWLNYSYDIFKYNESSLSFDSIGTTTATSYIDTGLINNRSYCYYIKSRGEYSIDGINKPLINLSQENCGQPKDTEPPCSPAYTVIGDCDLIKNTLNWKLIEGDCLNDAVSYTVYFKPFLEGPFEKIKTIEGNIPVEFIHERSNSIAGCYFITATDEYNNESQYIDSICVDNCPVYELPNVFSPDGDNINDYFQPFPYRFVESIDLKIMNRWGQLMFETNKPGINWNGVNVTTNKPCSEGVYYYICTVNEIRLSGIEPRVLKGFFHLFRNANVIPQTQD
ncbi:MAG: gliding motility-associated C-terminal domain-containing protein [Bacteroidetes bacterium]|nr:gliding motility-associated C-terminal domain-containing protein [Bacteroidota bacterium]HET6242962.1 gliding motility-associated C-terminal domain-containing protein [Bacteroidia bacterium]